MQITQFRSGAALERQIDAARQLRAETIGGGGVWIISAFGCGLAAIRRVILLLTLNTTREA